MSTLDSSFAVIECILSNSDYSEIDKCAIRNIADALLSLIEEHAKTLKELNECKQKYTEDLTKAVELEKQLLKQLGYL